MPNIIPLLCDIHMKDNIKEKALKLEYTKSEAGTLEVDLGLLPHPRWSAL